MVAQRKMETEERLMTEAEYLAFEERSRERHEFVDGVLRLMSGTTGAHNEIAQNFVEKLRPLARKKKCRTRIEAVKLRLSHVSSNRYYYPDFMIMCGPPTEDPSIEENPCMVVEILSKSTEHFDRGEKFETYLRTPSLQRYVLVHQTSRTVEVYERAVDSWTYRLLEETGAFDVPCIGARMTLEDVFEGVTFPEPKRRTKKKG
jgi:Uma2 family endonuclease